MKLTDEERAVWDAAYGAAFANFEYHRRYQRGECGHDWPPKTREESAIEARMVAEDAVDELRLHRSHTEGKEPDAKE